MPVDENPVSLFSSAADLWNRIDCNGQAIACYIMKHQ
jgi:hypothetical protein